MPYLIWAPNDHRPYILDDEDARYIPKYFAIWGWGYSEHISAHTKRFADEFRKDQGLQPRRRALRTLWWAEVERRYQAEDEAKEIRLKAAEERRISKAVAAAEEKAKAESWSSGRAGKRLMEEASRKPRMLGKMKSRFLIKEEDPIEGYINHLEDIQSNWTEDIPQF